MNLQFYDLHPSLADFKSEVLSGMGAERKRLSPKFFYDRRGSQLFDTITELPEYYPTRTEIGILERHAPAMAGYLGKDCLLLELGSGSSRKVRLLLDALRPAAYMPIDISRQHLLESAQTLAGDYPQLQIHATCADYSAPFELPHSPSELPRAAFFPGSSIGNFEPDAACLLLQRTRELLGVGGHLLIGVDLKKEPTVLNDAYNDRDGVTAAFNLNLLERMNRELEADFEIDHFAHYAFYNPMPGRIEMHLISRIPQQARIAGECVDFAEGESLHTENSYKYTVDGFQQLAAGAGFAPCEVWLDAEQHFSVHCLRAV
ncbi:L-histidine N(alpha)-methyltransferase [Endothiovibrio diazotrophicus]